MFRRKQDVDRHVSSILGKIKEDREKNAKGYQIARLYCEVREYEIARRYLANYLNERATVPQAYKLLGEIEEAAGRKDNAAEAYKRFIELGGNGKEVVLKICQLYSDIGVDPGVGKFWLEKAEQLYPQSEVVFKLKEQLIKAQPGENSSEYLEKLLSEELVKKPQDIDLRIKLLRLYLVTKPVDEAYHVAIETDRTTAFSTSLEWYECLYDVFKAYERERKPEADDSTFMFHYLVVLCNLTYLRLANKDVAESAEALYSLDRAVQAAINGVTNDSEMWDSFLTEMQGQLFFMAGTLLLKRAQKGSVTWNEMRPLAAVFFMLCQSTPTVDAQATWYIRPVQDRDKMYAWLYKNSFFRISQSGHCLYVLAEGDVASWAQSIQQRCCSAVGQERAFEALFPIRDMRGQVRESYLYNTHKFCNTTLHVPPKRQLYDVDRVAHLFHPDQLSELVWICLQQYAFDDPHQPDYNFKLFETLQYSVRNMENGAAETLCQLDTEAFLYATVRCTALQLKEQQMSIVDDMSRPTMLPLCLCKKLCTPEQQQWWQTAYAFYSNNIRDNFSKMRHTLQRGIEVTRLVGNHGLSCAMVVHLAKTFDAKEKSLRDGDHGNRGSMNQLACLEARAALYWNHALTVLTRMERNHRGPLIKVRLFDDGSDGDLTPEAIGNLLQAAKFATATIAMREGRYEEAIKGFEKLTTPYASFYRAQIFKSLAQQELEGCGPEEVKQQKCIALITQAREALYRTIDHLCGNKDHELNILLTRELDDVESKLASYHWDNEHISRLDLEEASALRTPIKQHHSHGDELAHSHSTPKSHYVARLLSSELGDSPIPQRAPMASSSAHARPSPERMDAQIKSLNYSQTGLFKVVMDRNEELAVMYRGLVEELRENNAQLKGALLDNHNLMAELKVHLTTNKDSMAVVQADIAEVKDTVRQLKEEVQAGAAASAMAANPALFNAQGLAAAQMSATSYLMGSPYHPTGYPPYAQMPGAAGYRYPLIPGYPTTSAPRQLTPVAAAAARLSGTAPSSFGKFRDHGSAADMMATVEDEEDEEENGMSMCGSEYGEGLLQTPVGSCYLPSSSDMHDWHGSSMAYPTHTQSSSAAIPQPGYFATALKGHALQYAPGGAQSLPMPGPGFFSVPAVTTANPAVQQSAIASALGGKLTPAVAVQQPQPIPVLGGATAKPSVPTTEAVLFADMAKLITTGEEKPVVEVSVVQDRPSKQGFIVLQRKDSKTWLSKHNVLAIKVTPSTNPTYFLWTAKVADNKPEETYHVIFDNAEQVKRLRTAIEHVIKSAGIRPQSSLSIGAKSPGLPAPQTQAVMSTPAQVRSPLPSSATTSPSVFGGKPSPTSTGSTSVFGGSKPIFQTTPAASATLAPAASSGKASFGGFTFSTTPVVKQGEDASKEPAKSVTPQFKLKESAITVSSATVTPTTSSTLTSTATTDKPFAGFSFTKPATTPAFGAATTASTGGQAFVFGSNSSGPTFSSISQGTSQDVLKPKEGAGSGFAKPAFAQPVPSVKSPGGKDDDALEEYEPNVDFKPIIDLPDLVEVKTGEENESKVFSDRVKLFRFDSETSQWKERGIGELKILKSEDGARFRVLMRREQVLKVCANHYISPDMKLTPLSASDRAWCYTTSDFAEQEVKVEKFAIKFKNPDKAGEFKSIFESCQKEMVEAEKAHKEPAKPMEKALEKSDGAKPKSLAEQFRPQEGSWECTGCYVNNAASVLRCLACQTLKPGAKAEDASKKPTKEDPFAVAPATGGFGGFKLGDKPAAGGATGGGFKFGEKPSAPAGGGFKFGASTGAASAPTATPAAPAPTAGGAKGKSLAEMFKPSEGSWECSGCYVVNKSDILKCPACQTTKPGAKPQPSDAKSPPKEDPFAPAAASGFGGYTFGMVGDKKETGFKFGGFAPKTEAAATTTTTTTTSASNSAASAGFKFTFDTPTKPGFSFGTKPTTATTTTTSSTTTAGFSFGPTASSTPSTSFSFSKPQTSAEESECGSELLKQLLTEEETTVSSKPSGFQAKLGHVTSPNEKSPSGFSFTFSKKKQAGPTVPKSPEEDEQDYYFNKEGEDSHIYFEPVVPLPEKIEVKTGEEDEAVLFESRAKLYRFTSNEWKERGLGVIKILQHSQTGKIRILMRREQVLKICCNHFITAELDLKPMARSEGKAWVWYAMDFTEGEGKMEQLAVRFRDTDTANNFKKVFDESKEKMKTPSKQGAASVDPSAVGPSPGAVSRRLFDQEEDDDDVQFVSEEKPTADQIERARKLLLPDTFYLYENRPGCPGCIGCEDFDVSKAAAAPQKGMPPTIAAQSARAWTPKTPTSASEEAPVKEDADDKASVGMLFGGGSSVSFSTLAAAGGDTSGFGSKDPSKPFHWAGAGQRLFGQATGGEEGEDGEVPPSEDIHFEPVVPLPDLVEVKTGEEDWTTLFSQRAKVYCFDSPQWKERGIGEMKISQHKSKLMFRVLLRREQVLKIACNHLITTSMELMPMATSETAWCWIANDFTDGEGKMSKFAVKFKKIEVAKEFKTVFEDCQEKLRQGQSGEAVQEMMVSSSKQSTGDIGNVQALEVSTQNIMTAGAQPVMGDKDNMLYSKQLDVAAQDAVTAEAQPVTGDKGNPFYTQQLEASVQDTMVSSSQPVQGDKGNPYMTKALDVAAQDALVTFTAYQPLVEGGSPNFSQLLGAEEGGAEKHYEDYEDNKDEEDDDDEDDDDDEEDEDEDDEDEIVEMEKRVTLFSREGEQWKKLSMGNLRVLYDDDLNCNKIDVLSDKGEQLCNHVIYKELTVTLDAKKKSCEWHPIDYATNEPVQRHFKAYFSSLQAAQEFDVIFEQGVRLAESSDISVRMPEEIEVPEVYSTTGQSEGASK